MESTIPNNWVKVKMGDFFHIERGGSPRPIKEYITGEEDGVNWIKIGDTKNSTKYIFETKEKIKPEGIRRSRMVYENDFLLSNSMSFGRPYIMKTEGCIHDGWLVIRENKSVNADFLYYVLSSDVAYSQFESLAKGSTVRNLNIQLVQRVNIPIAPLPEQKRIVAKLDGLFAHLEEVKTRLDKVPQLLKDFRQAVLTQAVTGKLTEEWREGRDLPEWKEIELQELANVIDPQPSHRTPPIHKDAIPYVSIKDVNKKGEVVLKNARTVSKQVLAEHIKRYDLLKGDFGFGKIGTLGKPFLLPMFGDRRYTLSANIILIQPRRNCHSKFIFYYLNSPIIEQKLIAGSNSTSQPAFGIKKARVFPTPLPTMEEQTEIVSRVEELFSKVEAITAKYNSLKQKVDNLPQSILAKAFKGEMVEQFESDGDAKELLKEIEVLKEEVQPKNLVGNNG